MSKKITAIYVNAKIRYFICIYAYKPENLPAFMHISQKYIYSLCLHIYILIYIPLLFEKNQSTLSIISNIFLTFHYFQKYSWEYMPPITLARIYSSQTDLLQLFFVSSLSSQTNLLQLSAISSLSRQPPSVCFLSHSLTLHNVCMI